tara:strand:- start:34414 stop:34731 length:318 start_codon:yes stop_codon:yes gene_type:complete
VVRNVFHKDKFMGNWARSKVKEKSVSTSLHGQHRVREAPRGASVSTRDGPPRSRACRARIAQRRKVLLVSTPTIRGLRRIEREFEASDQRRFFVPCPNSGHVQSL